MSGISVNNVKASAAARLRRHERVFGKHSMLMLGLKKAQDVMFVAGSILTKYTGLGFAMHTAKAIKARYDAHIVPPTPGTLYKRLSVLTVGMLSVTVVFGSTFDVSYAEYGSEEYLTQVSQEGTLVADQDGYFTKANPQTITKTDRTFKDVASYTIESGDTLSLVAQQFRVKPETLMWENGITLASVLKVGQRLNIPPADGVSHRVASGQSVEKIAALYSVPAQKIVAINDLQGGTISQGQVIFVPDAKPLPQAKPVVRTVAGKVAAPTRAAGRDAPSRNVDRVTLKGNNSAPAAGKFMIFPTVGALTQGFRSGHYAYDIANRSMPPIWAAAGGTVVKASSGTWGGGYGTHVIIDHGNGVKTLYAHLDYLTVKAGDQVSQGQVMGRMGRTGNVRGVTGIHLHFEVIDRGVKKAPNKFY